MLRVCKDAGPPAGRHSGASTRKETAPFYSCRQPHRLPTSRPSLVTVFKRRWRQRPAAADPARNGGAPLHVENKEALPPDQTQLFLQAQQYQLAEMQKQMLAMQQIMISQQQQNQRLMEAMAQMTSAQQQAQVASMQHQAPAAPQHETAMDPESQATAHSEAPETTTIPPQAVGASTPAGATAAAAAAAAAGAAVPATLPPSPEELPSVRNDTADAAPLPPPPALIKELSLPPPPPPSSSRRSSPPASPTVRKIRASTPPSIFKPHAIGQASLLRNAPPAASAPQTEAAAGVQGAAAALATRSAASGAAPVAAAMQQAPAAETLGNSSLIPATPFAPAPAATRAAAAATTTQPAPPAAEAAPSTSLAAAAAAAAALGTQVQGTVPEVDTASSPAPEPATQPGPPAASDPAPASQLPGPAPPAAAAPAATTTGTTAAAAAIETAAAAAPPPPPPAAAAAATAPAPAGAPPAAAATAPAPAGAPPAATATSQPPAGAPPAAARSGAGAAGAGRDGPASGRWAAPPSASAQHQSTPGGSLKPTGPPCPVQQAASQLRRTSSSRARSQTQPFSSTELDQIVATALPSLETAPVASLAELLRELDALALAAGVRLSPSSLAALVRALGRRCLAAAPAPSKAAAGGTAPGAPPAVAGAPAAGAPTAAASLSEHVPTMLAALSRMVPAGVWGQPLAVRVLDPLHKLTYVDVAAQLLNCMQASDAPKELQLSNTLTALRAAASIQQQHRSSQGGTSPAPSHRPAPGLQTTNAPQQQLPQQQQQQLLQGPLETAGEGLVQHMLGEVLGGDGAAVPGVWLEALGLQGARRLADGLLDCLTLRIPHSSLDALLAALVPRLLELDAQRLAAVGHALTTVSSGGGGSASGILHAWPQLFQEASLAHLQQAGGGSSSSSGAHTRGGSGSEAGLGALAAFAHVLVCVGAVPGEAWLAAFAYRLRLLLGLGVGAPQSPAAAQPAAAAGMAGQTTAPVSAATLAQLCGACAVFTLADPAFQLSAGCTQRLQSWLEAVISKSRPTGAAPHAAGGGSGGGGSGVGISAAELVDVLWGLEVMGQHPSDAHLNMLVILGTAQLNALPRASLVRAACLVPKGTSVNAKWWAALQHTLLVSLSSAARGARGAGAEVGGQGAVLSKPELLQLLPACAGVEQLACASTHKVRPAAAGAPAAAKGGKGSKGGKASGGGGGSGSASSGVASPALAQMLLQSAHALASTGHLQAGEVVQVVEVAAGLEAVRGGEVALSTLMLQQYEAASMASKDAQQTWAGGEGEHACRPGSSRSSSSSSSSRKGASSSKRQHKAGEGGAPAGAAAVAATERAVDVAWAMAQSGYTPGPAWRSSFVASVTGTAPESTRSPRVLLRALGAMYKLRAYDAPLPFAWLSAVLACVSNPPTLRGVPTLELARACLGVQDLQERQQQEQQQQQQQQQQQGREGPREEALPDKVSGQAVLQQELVRKLQGPGQAKLLSAGDVVDVVKMCAFNRVEVGAPLGAELARLLSSHAESLPLPDLVYASNAASALKLQGHPQQMELQTLLQTLTKRTHLALATGEEASNGGLGNDASETLALLLTVLATCTNYQFSPSPLQMAAYMARIEDVLEVCQPSMVQIEEIFTGLVLFQIQPSETLLSRLAASLQSIPASAAAADASLLEDLLRLHLMGKPLSSAYLSLFHVSCQRLLGGLQASKQATGAADAVHAVDVADATPSSSSASTPLLIPTDRLLLIIPGLIKVDKDLSPLVQLCLEQLLCNVTAAVATEAHAQRMGQPAEANGSLLHPSCLSGLAKALFSVVGVTRLHLDQPEEPVAQHGPGTMSGYGTPQGAGPGSHPVLATCHALMSHVERWAQLKLPLLSNSQMAYVCKCYSVIGMVPSPDLMQRMQPHLLSTFQTADADMAFELMVFFHDKVLHASPRDSAVLPLSHSAAAAAAAADSAADSSLQPRRQPKQSVQEGARQVCAAALKRVMALKVINEEGEIVEFDGSTSDAEAALCIMPGVERGGLILALEYMHELGVGPYSSAWQHVLLKTVAQLGFQDGQLQPESWAQLVQVAMAIMPQDQVYDSWWSATVHLAAAQLLVSIVPKEVEEVTAAYMFHQTADEQRRIDQEHKEQLEAACAFFKAQDQKGKLSLKDQRMLQEYWVMLQQRQQQQQQQQQDGTSYGIPSSSANILAPYSEAVKGLDDVLGTLAYKGAPPFGDPSQRPGDMTVDVQAQGTVAATAPGRGPAPQAGDSGERGSAHDQRTGAHLALPPAKAATLLSMCLALPHAPRREWMDMLWAAVLPSLRATAEAAEEGGGDGLEWLLSEQHWDLHALAMLAALSLRTGHDPGLQGGQALARAAAPQLLRTGAPPQAAIAVLQVLVCFNHHPGEAWLHHFVSALQPTLHTLLAGHAGGSVQSSDSSRGSSTHEEQQESAMLASVLVSFAALSWAPPEEWLAKYYTVLCKGSVPLLSHKLLCSVSTSLAKILSLQAEEQRRRSMEAGEGEGQFLVPRALVDLLAEEVTVRCTGRDAAGQPAGAAPDLAPDDAHKLSSALEVLRML